MPSYNQLLELTEALSISFNNANKIAFYFIINLLYYLNYDFDPCEEI